MSIKMKGAKRRKKFYQDPGLNNLVYQMGRGRTLKEASPCQDPLKITLAWMDGQDRSIASARAIASAPASLCVPAPIVTPYRSTSG
ncbi:hypothetical protein ACOMHN_032205 [Nucella lapillus]